MLQIITALASFLFLWSNFPTVPEPLKSLHSKNLDILAIHYCKRHSNAYIASIFPIAKDDEAMIGKIFEQYGKVKYVKKFFLHDYGPVNFINLLYQGHGASQGLWLGNRINKFKGARQTAKFRFSGQAPLRLYVFVCKDLQSVRACKRALRKFFGKGLESMHINDTHEETIKIANIMFNEKNTDTLNSSNFLGI